MGAFTEITAAIAARMAVRGTGAIVNIASTGAYAPAPVLAAYAAYAASKAYVLSFTQALWAEMQHANVRVVAVSPGPTQTPMNPSVGGGKRQPADVAETVLAVIDGSGPTVVDGLRNRMTAAVIRLLPALIVTRLALRAMSDR